MTSPSPPIPAFCPTVEGMGFAAYPAGSRSLGRTGAVSGGDAWTGASVPPADLPRYLIPGDVRSDPGAADARRPGTDPRALAARAADPRQRRDGRRGRGRGRRDRHVEHSFGLLRPLSIRQAATDVVARQCRRRRPQPGRRRARRRDRISTSARPGSSSRRSRPSRASSVSDPVEIEEPPDPAFEAWLAGRDGRPLVYLTLGTVFNDGDSPAVDRRRHRRPRRRHRGHARAGRRPVDRRRPAGARPRGVVHPAGAGPPAEPGHDQPRRLGRDAGRDRGRRPDPRHPAGRRPVHERRADPRGRAGSPGSCRTSSTRSVVRTRLSTLLDDRPVRGDAPRVYRADLESMPPPSDVVDALVRLAGGGSPARVTPGG